MASGKNSSKKNKKPMSKAEKLIYTIVIIVLVLAIAGVSVLVLYPRFAGRPDWHIKAFFSFDDSEWIEEMVEGRIESKDKVLDIKSSFVYSKDTAFVTTVYGSRMTIADAKQYYLEAIPGSTDLKSDSVSSMMVRGTLDGEDIEVVNYEADILNAIDTKVDIDKEMADFIKKLLIDAYPTELVSGYPEFAAIMQSEKLGGYVEYDDNELSSSSYPGAPIYSQAYRYGGSREDLYKLQMMLKDKYAHSLYFEELETLYFMDAGYIFSLAITQSDVNILAAISVQEIPKDKLAEMEQAE